MDAYVDRQADIRHKQRDGYAARNKAILVERDRYMDGMTHKYRYKSIVGHATANIE
jgi:hypothetical protein